MARAAEVVLKEIDSLLDELVEAVAEPAPAAVVCEQVRAAGRVRHRVEAAFTTLLGHLDWSAAYGDDGAVNAKGWLTWALHVTKPAAGRVVADSRALRSMAGTEAAYAAGDIGPAQVWLLRLAHSTDARAFARDEELLLGHARSMRCEVFARVVKHWMYLADPDRDENQARRNHDRRHVQLSPTFQDTWALDGLLDVIGGTILHNELRRLTAPSSPRARCCPCSLIRHRAGGVRGQVTGDRRGGDPALLRRGHPPGRGDPRPGVLT